MKPFSELILKSEQWLMKRTLSYAIARNYARYTSTLEEAWRASIAGLSQALAQAYEERDAVPEMDTSSRTPWRHSEFLKPGGTARAG